MKRFKKVFVLLGILVALCIVTLVVLKIEEKKEKINNTDAVILAVSPDTVNKLSWEYEGNSISLHKDGSWKWDDDDNFPVDEKTINNLLSTFEEFKASFIIEEVDDFKQYGMDDPVCTIRFSTDSEDYEVTLGSFSTMDSQRYVSVNDGNVYLLSSDPFDQFNIELADIILDDNIPTFEQIDRINFEGAQNYAVNYQENGNYSYCEDDKYYTEQDGTKLALDTSRVENYCSGISLINLSNYISYNVTDEELSSWGLDNPKLTVSINYTNTDDSDNKYEGSLKLSAGLNKEEEKAYNEESEDDKAEYPTAYIRVGDSKIVYEITKEEYESIIAASYNDLRHTDVLSAAFTDVDSFDITLDGAAYKITMTSKEEDGETVHTYFYNGKEIDITGFRNQIQALSVNEFTDEAPNEKEEIGLVFNLNNASFPKVSVEIYRYDGTNCLVVIDGKTVGLLERTSVVNLIEAVNQIVLG